MFLINLILVIFWKKTDNTCSSLTNCYTCIADESCGWCNGEKKCILGTKYGGVNKKCLEYSFSVCSDPFCSYSTTCEDCVFDDDCRWCNSRQLCLSAAHSTEDDCYNETMINSKESACKQLGNPLKEITNLLECLNSTLEINPSEESVLRKEDEDEDNN